MTIKKKRVINVPYVKRVVSIALILALTLTLLTTVALADEPYTAYQYDWYGDVLPSQNGYIATSSIRGQDIDGCGALNNPNDMFISADRKFYIADTDNNRIVVLDENFKFIKEIKEVKDSGGTVTTLNKPEGVFVTADNEIYIADTINERVIGITQDGNIFASFYKPDVDAYDKDAFQPKKVIVDKSNNVFVLVDNITLGALEFTYDKVSGNVAFKSFYGANRVEETAEVVKNKFFSIFLNDEQMAKRKKAAPVEFSNFDIDEDGFVYTVTKASSSEKTTDILKKLNPGGTNIFADMGYSNNSYGNETNRYYGGKNYFSKIVDVDIGDNGIINIIDQETNRIFQYNENCNLLFEFGGTGNQTGLFAFPVAVESLDNKVYVLDMRKDSVTTFERTQFGEYVHKAEDLHLQGLYDEAKDLWEEVMRRDGNYYFSYVGIGRAYLNAHDYKTAMYYFNHRSIAGYNKAFKYYRREFIRDNFTVMAIVLIVAVVAIIVIRKLLKKRKIKKLTEGKVK